MIPAVEFSAGGFFFFSVVIYSSLLSPALGARCRCLLCSGFTASSAGKCGMRPGENLNRSHKVTSMRLLSPGKLLPLVCIIYILLSPFCSDKSFIAGRQLKVLVLSVSFQSIKKVLILQITAIIKVVRDNTYMYLYFSSL